MVKKRSNRKSHVRTVRRKLAIFLVREAAIIRKTIRWNAIAGCVTFGTSFWATGNIRQAVSIAIMTCAEIAVLYPLHDKVWSRISWHRDSRNATRKHIRLVIKSLTYRFLSSTGTALIAWFFIDEVKTARTIGLVDCAIKLALYYGHEFICEHRMGPGPLKASLADEIFPEPAELETIAVAAPLEKS